MKNLTLAWSLILVLAIPAYSAQSRDDVVAPEGAANVAPGAAVSLVPEGVGVLYDNGPLVNSVGTGSGGADESVLQTTSLGMNTIGFGHQVLNGNRMADDFVIADPDGWHIDEIIFYAYQTGSPTTSTITAVNLRIWDGPPNAGGAVIWGDTTTNVLTSTTFSNVFRVTETTGGAADRPIMENRVLVDADFPAGTYWLDWQADGSLASGPWAPPVTITGQAVTGNALQSLTDNGVTWAPALDTGAGTPQQGLPFVIEGEILGGISPLEIPTASTIGLLLLVLALAAIAIVRLR